MKKIDRYISKAYILRFLMAHVIIFGLYMSFDIMQRVDMFYEAGAGRTLPQILLFYLYQVPGNIMYTVPPLLMLSAGLVFVRMHRNGELLTLRASGISLQRVALPLFLITLPVIMLLAAARETVIPDLYRQRNLLENKMDGRVSGPFFLSDQTGENGTEYELFVGDYDFQKEIMHNISILMPYEDSAPPRKIVEADSATWANAGALRLNRGTVRHFDRRGNLAEEPEAFGSLEWPTSLRVSDFLDAQDDELTTRAPAMTLARLRERIAESPHNPRFRVLFHTRMADSLTPIILMLLGIPVLAGYGKHHKSRLVGILVSIIIMSIYYVLTFIALSIGNAGLVDPAVASWFIPAAGMLCGLVVFLRMPS